MATKSAGRNGVGATAAGAGSSTACVTGVTSGTTQQHDGGAGSGVTGVGHGASRWQHDLTGFAFDTGTGSHFAANPMQHQPGGNASWRAQSMATRRSIPKR